MFTVSFFGDEEQYPRYQVGGNFLTQHDALLACEADLRRQAMNGRKYYNDLCYYDITEYNEEDERGDTVNAAELLMPLPFEETVQVKIVRQRNGRSKAIYRSLLVDGKWDRTWFRMNLDAARKGLQRGYAHVGIYPNVKVVKAEGSL